MSTQLYDTHTGANDDQIHHVEDEQYLGSLLNANDALVHALMSFEQLDRSIDADSDSDDELAEQAHMYRSKWCHPEGPLKQLT